MKRAFYGIVLFLFLLLTACAAPQREDPPEVPAPEPVTTEPEPADPKPAEPEYSPVNPKPVYEMRLEAGERYAVMDSRGYTEMPAAPFIEHDTFYFPLQFVAEAMGVRYAFADGCAYLQCDGRTTQFFIDSPRFIVDGVEGQVSGTRTLFREGLSTAPVDGHFTPLLRDGVVFLPLDYLPVEVRMSYNSFGQQIQFDGETYRVHFQNDRFPPTEVKTAHAVTLYNGVAEALVDGQRKPLSAAPFVENSIFYYPIEEIAEWMGVGYSRNGETIRLYTPDNDFRIFLNSRQFVWNGKPGMRDGWRTIFTSAPLAVTGLAVDGRYVPLERDGVVFLPSDYFQGEMCSFFSVDEYGAPEPGMVIFSRWDVEERGIGGFYLGHMFDETPPELRAGLHLIGKLGEFEEDYDIMGYAGDGLLVHVLRLRPGRFNGGLLDGTISSVLTADPNYVTPRGFRCGDLPRRGWELYGWDFSYMFYFQCAWPDGPVSAIRFVYAYKELPMRSDSFHFDGVPESWLEMPAFWEEEQDG